jgi:hypothetical protein
MMSYHVSRPYAVYVVLTLIFMTLGCSSKYKVAEVDGTLTIHGKPGNKIHIQFVPMGPPGVKLPASNADTDDQGKFMLEMWEGNTVRQGAVVGTNRVVLSDTQFADAGPGSGVPFRLKQEYTLPASTPLAQEVAEGKQTIEIKIP